jgi:hypothetical protein
MEQAEYLSFKKRRHHHAETLSNLWKSDDCKRSIFLLWQFPNECIGI